MKLWTVFGNGAEIARKAFRSLGNWPFPAFAVIVQIQNQGTAIVNCCWKISPSATNEIGLYGRLSKTAAATTKTMIARTKRISSFFFIPDTSKCQSAKNSNITPDDDYIMVKSRKAFRRATKPNCCLAYIHCKYIIPQIMRSFHWKKRSANCRAP